MANLREIHRTTIATYEANATAWDSQRPKMLFEKPWLDRFVRRLPENGEILDVGCGAGVPIAQYLIDLGFAVTGIDASPKMIELSRRRFPQHQWRVMDMRALSLGRSFDGIISWDGFFHLDPDEQRDALRIFCRHLRPGGALLLTVGDEAGEVLGIVNGEQVYHASLAPAEYRSILEQHGFTAIEIVLRDPDCDQHSVLLASGDTGVSK